MYKLCFPVSVVGNSEDGGVGPGGREKWKNILSLKGEVMNSVLSLREGGTDTCECKVGYLGLGYQE